MTISMEIPQELYDRAVAIANAQSMSLAEVLNSAFADYVAAWERLEQRAQQGNREKFLAVLAKIPDVEPLEHDRF